MKKTAFKRYTKRVLSKGDAEEADAWLLAYPLFSTSSSPTRELFDLWEKRYGDVAARPDLTEDTRTGKLARLNAFAAAWCRSHSGDLSARQMGKILQWATKNDPPLANEIKLLLLRNRQTTTASVGVKDSTAATAVEPTTAAAAAAARADTASADQSTPRQQTKRLVDFMEIPEPVLARELTIIEWQLFQEVNVRSLLTTTKTQPGGDSLFEPIIAQYKLVSHWVATEILVTKSTTVQVQVLEKFIRLAAQFLQLNNFNSFMEIVSGLNHNSVQRLKGLWERVSEKAREQWSEMDVLMSPQHNFRHYRRELKKRKAPVLPYFGIYLRDFTFINDGNQQYKPDGSINDKYVHLLYERAQEVRNFQSVPYTLASAGRSPAVQGYLASLPTQVVYDEEELYALSLKAQPSLWIDPTKGEGAESDTSESSVTSQSLPGALVSSHDSRRNQSHMSDIDTDKDFESDSAFNHRTDASDMSEKADDDECEEEEVEEDISEFSESVDEKPVSLAGLKLTISEADVEAKPTEMPKNEAATKSESDVVIGREGRVMSMVKDFNAGGRPIDSGAQPTRASPLRLAHAHSSDDLPDSTASSISKTRKNKDDKKTKKVKKDSVQRLKASLRRSASSPSPTPVPSSSSAAGSTSLSTSSAPTSEGSPSPSASLAAAAQAAIKERQKRTLRVGEAVAGGEAPKPKCRTVRVPPAFDPLFYTAERIVHRYFSECYQSARTGTISIFDERYLMLRAPSLSVDFFTAIAETFAAGGVLLSASHRELVAQRLLFDFAHAVGRSDARNFMRKMNLSFGPEGLSAGPVHFSYTGWAVVQLHDTCRPSPNDECYLHYDHPFSFESYSWSSQQAAQKKVPHHPVCVMNAGYSSGWTGVSMGNVDLVAAEVMCMARGDTACRFIMAHPTKIQAHLTTFFDENNFSAEKRNSVIIHRFLASKKTFQYLNDAEAEADGDGTRGTQAKAKSAAAEVPKAERKSDVVKSLINRWKGRAAPAPAPASPIPAPFDRKVNAEAIGQQTAEIERVITTETKRSRRLMKAIFDNQVLDPRHGNVTIDGHRHIFIRGEAISYEFFHLLREMFPADQRADAQLFASKFLFDFARSLGKTDQRFYTRKVLQQESSSFVQMFLTLPSLLAHMGWGVMKLYAKEANLDVSCGESGSGSGFYLKFALHQSVEARVWKKKESEAGEEQSSGEESCGDHDHNHGRAQSPRGDYSRPPVCLMAAGYITGFANECLRASQGQSAPADKQKGGTTARLLKLGVVEVACEALGHGSRCTFIMAPRESIGQCAREYLDRKKRAHFVQHVHLGLVQSRREASA